MNLDMDNVTAIGQDSVIQEKQTCIEDKSNQDSQKDHRRSRTVLFLYCALLIEDLITGHPRSAMTVIFIFIRYQIPYVDEPNI